MIKTLQNSRKNLGKFTECRDEKEIRYYPLDERLQQFVFVCGDPGASQTPPPEIQINFPKKIQ